MNESANKTNVAEAIFGIVFIFFLVGVFLYKFGTDKDIVVNKDAENSVDSKIELLTQFENSKTENDLYKKYAQEIYNTQTEDQTGVETQNKVEKIVSDYQKNLENEVVLPPQSVSLKNVSSMFTNKHYADNFEIMFSEFKAKGGTSEGLILSTQITSDGNLLVLSPDDKETILRVADEYEIFSNKIQNLSTPTLREKIGREIAISTLNISYILRKLANEEDKNIYTLWISKYAENMSVIITDRYALNTK